MENNYYILWRNLKGNSTFFILFSRAHSVNMEVIDKYGTRTATVPRILHILTDRGMFEILWHVKIRSIQKGGTTLESIHHT